MTETKSYIASAMKNSQNKNPRSIQRAVLKWHIDSDATKHVSNQNELFKRCVEFH